MRLARLLSFTLLLHLHPALFSQIIDLKGTWKFHLGDQTECSAPSFDDSKWPQIKAPGYWEDQGFHGYDGYAWYRKKFDGTLLDKNKNYYLNLGYIDDADEVYLNGRLIGFSGMIRPFFITAFNQERKYQIPPDLINYQGENVIAVQVVDFSLGGGIFDGNLGIFESKDKLLLLDLKGVWLLSAGKKRDQIKKEVMVPSRWESQGFPGYDGIAWYKRSFSFTHHIPNEPLVLLAGKIDDFDEVYFNGVLIGKTSDGKPFGPSESWKQQRVYLIPDYVLNKKGLNTIEIRVDDLRLDGGIYSGIVGIATKANYEKYRE